MQEQNRSIARDKMVNKWLKIVQHFIESCLSLPCHCLLCLRPSRRNFALCEQCESGLPWFEAGCSICGLPLEKATYCLTCLQAPPAYDKLCALWDYCFPVANFISHLKFGGELHFAKLLGSLMANHLTLTQSVDCIVPLPLHPRRQQERGFNQTLELARPIAAKWQLPIDKYSCRRISYKSAQAQLSARKRRKNVKAQAFQIADSLAGKRVLVIEDVITTGTTANAFARALKEQGVASVEIWACCRTLI